MIDDDRMEVGTVPRVAILFDNFGPYHLARLRAAASTCEVIAMEGSLTSGTYSWNRGGIPEGLNYLALPRETGDLLPFLRARLLTLKPDCIALPGWSSPLSLRILRWAAEQRIPMVLMSESNRWDHRRTFAGEAIKRSLVSTYTSALVSSRSHSDYLIALGMKQSSIYHGYNVVDNEYFYQAALHAASKSMPEGDRGLLPEEVRGKYFLASGRFVEKKNFIRLLQGYARFRASRPAASTDWPLVLLGDGELRSALVLTRDSLRLTEHVHLPGFRQIEELPRYYGTAGAFIHPSTTEQWGLVVNEAMASGLPVAVSSRCGCAEVLISPGVTGLIFDPTNVDDIAVALGKLTNPTVAAQLHCGALARIADWTPERFGNGLRDAAQHAVRAGGPRLRPTSRLAIAAAIAGMKIGSSRA